MLRDRLPIPIRLGNWIFIKKFGPASGNRTASGSRKMRGKRWPNNFRAELSGIPILRGYTKFFGRSLFRQTQVKEETRMEKRKFGLCYCPSRKKYPNISLLFNILKIM